jgi:PhnB protein
VSAGPPPAATAISVMLIVPDADTAIAWYRDALGATELWNLGGVAGLQVGDAPFFVHEAVPGRAGEVSADAAGVTSVRIELFVEDPDAVRARAIASGATPAAEMTDHQMPWGTHRQGGFRDPFGHAWSVGDRSPLSPACGP